MTNPTDLHARMVLRPLTMDDYDELIALQLACFPGMEVWTRHNLRSQLEHWELAEMGLFLDGRLVASAAQLIVHYDDYTAWSSWKELSDNGDITNHDPDGDTLYGIEIQVHPDMRGMRLSRRLYDWRKALCRERNLARIVIGGRLPGYQAVRNELTPREYVDAVMTKERFDPVLTAQLANGFLLTEIVEDYLPSDEDSAGYATCLEWPNLDYIPKRSKRSRRATQPVRVSFVQYQMRAIEAFTEFERQVTFFVDTAADYRADIVLFPELFTLQLLSLVPDARPGTAARELAHFTPKINKLFANLALRFNINIIAGSTFVERDDGLYNVAHLFHRDGRIETQDKIHVTPSEASWWGVRGGDEVKVFETDVGRIGILICYDVEFPELVRRLAERHVRLLFVPYNTDSRYGHQRVKLCTQARCIENHLFAVTAGCVGNLPFVENADVHYAQSAVLTPCDLPFARDGVAVDAETNLEMVVAHDLDLEVARRHRRQGTTRNWMDRRTDLYEVVWKTPR